MKFLLGGLGNWYNDYPSIKEMVLEADNYDFEACLMPDHYMWGMRENARMNRPDNYRTVDTWVAMSYLAGKTEHIKLGTLVTPVPFRPPAMMAKMVATLDNLSNGRVIFGVGAGWSRDEFDGYSEWVPDKIRVDRTKEGLELMLKLWTSKDPVTFEGNHYKTTKAVVDPQPIQKPYPPLLFGGSGNRMLSMAGQYGDLIFVPPWGDPSQFKEKKDRVLRSAKKNNRENKLNFVGGMIGGGPKVENIKDYTEIIESAKTEGNKYFMISFNRDTDGLKLMKEFAKEIIPSFS